MTQAIANTRVEFHILQSFPVTCLNRDDVGAPKTAIIGGVTRARVSSQCWKRQVRLVMSTLGIKLGIRTKNLTELLKKACLQAGAGEAPANECAKKIAKAFSDDTLIFISENEIAKFAEYAAGKKFQHDKIEGEECYRIGKKTLKLNSALDGLDIFLFGRMVAKASEMNIEAATSFSHAISTHKVSNEIDFFTALDDLSDDQGSAHMGTLEFNSATYYRYICLNLGQLAKNLDSVHDLKLAIENFTKALYIALPSARQTTQSGASPWEFAKILVRTGQPLQVPFETAVRAQAGGYLQPSIEMLKSYVLKKEKLAGSLFGKIADYEFGENENFSIDDLITNLKKHVE